MVTLLFGVLSFTNNLVGTARCAVRGRRGAASLPSQLLVKDTILIVLADASGPSSVKSLAPLRLAVLRINVTLMQ